MSKHTPGPWEVFHSANKGKAVQISVPIEKGGDYIATCRGDNREANAKLISCAPEMLSVLKAVKAMFDNDFDVDIKEIKNATYHEIESALKRAKGQ